MAPTSVGIVSAAKALQDEGLCDSVKVSGLGVPAEMTRVHDERLRAGIRALELRRSRLPDLLCLLPPRDRRRSRASKARASTRAASGRTPSGRPDPTGYRRVRIVMGPFSVYNEDNPGVSAEATPAS